jgi:hypothetical protein
MHTPQHLTDAMIRHWIDVQAVGATTSADIATLLANEDVRLVSLLRARLPRAKTRAAINALVDDVRALRKETFAKVHAAIKADLLRLAQTEASLMPRIIGAPNAQPIPAATLKRMADTSRTIGSAMRDADGNRIVAALRQALLAGEPPEAIIARIAGTPAARYADGVLAATRRNAATEVKTAVTQVTAKVQEAWGQANPGAILGWEWDAILDGDTCKVCTALDGGFIANDNADRPRLGRRTVDARSLRNVRALPGVGEDRVKMDKARRIIAEGQRDPVRLTMDRRGVMEVDDGRHRLAAAIEAGVKVKIRVVKGYDRVPPGMHEIKKERPPVHRRCRCGLLPVLDDSPTVPIAA